MKALITGITGMDGSHLADFLLGKGYEVYGLKRWTSQNNNNNIKHIIGQIKILTGDLTDQNSILLALEKSNPDEVYNLASQSFVGESWNLAECTCNITGMGVLRVLDAIKSFNKNIKFYQASSSEMFGKMEQSIADENTQFHPRSPYGVAKLFGHWISRNYRESYKMFNCNGILFNHESERRGIAFVTRKITSGVAKIYHGTTNFIELGNLDARRDWGYAPDYIESMWLMLQQEEPDDYVVATGKTYSVKDFLNLAFKSIGIKDWSKYVKQNKKFIRPAEVDFLCGDSSKAKKVLKWEPKVSLEEIVKKMVEHDMILLEK